MQAKLFLSSSQQTPASIMKQDTNEFFFVFVEDKEDLIIFRNAKIIFRLKAKIGDAFICTLTGKKFNIAPLKLPRKRSDVVAWALGYPRDYRVDKLEQFTNKFNSNYVLASKGKKLPEISITDNKYYAIGMCKPDAFNFTLNGNECMEHVTKNAFRPVRLAAYISEDITPQAIAKLFSSYLDVDTFDFPIAFFEKLCLRLGLSKNEISKLVKHKAKKFHEDAIVPESEFLKKAMHA